MLNWVIFVLVVLVAVNTVIIGMMYTRWGKRLAVIADVQTIARAYYEMAQGLAHKSERTLERALVQVPEAAKEGAKEGAREASNGSGIHA